MALIESKTGAEQHTSSWGKFYIHGLKLVKEDYTNDRHHSYTTACTDVPDNTLFTVWAASGDKRGTDEADYYILRADNSREEQEIENGYGYVKGRWEVLAHGDGKVRGLRLMQWALKQPLNERLARHLGTQIHIRGKAQPDPLEDA